MFKEELLSAGAERVEVLPVTEIPFEPLLISL